MNKLKINRINELARIAKIRELTDAEKEEQKKLREEYLHEFHQKLFGETGKKS